MGLFLSQSMYSEEILERTHMQKCNRCMTQLDTESKLRADGDLVSDPTLYRSLAGALQHLTFTSLDISYAIQQVCPYMHDPREPYLAVLKCTLRYVRGTIDHGLVSSTNQLTIYTDADWVGCPVTQRGNKRVTCKVVEMCHTSAREVHIPLNDPCSWKGNTHTLETVLTNVPTFIPTPRTCLTILHLLLNYLPKKVPAHFSYLNASDVVCSSCTSLTDTTSMR
ncbi:ribonuclease H-like domain-containing protein [Tanacetum coccineum]